MAGAGVLEGVVELVLTKGPYILKTFLRLIPARISGPHRFAKSKPETTTVSVKTRGRLSRPRTTQLSTKHSIPHTVA